MVVAAARETMAHWQGILQPGSAREAAHTATFPPCQPGAGNIDRGNIYIREE